MGSLSSGITTLISPILLPFSSVISIGSFVTLVTSISGFFTGTSTFSGSDSFSGSSGSTETIITGLVIIISFKVPSGGTVISKG